MTVTGTSFVGETAFGPRIRQCAIECWDGSAWQHAATGTIPAVQQTDQRTALTTTKIRLSFTNATDGLTIKELHVFGD